MFYFFLSVAMDGGKGTEKTFKIATTVQLLLVKLLSWTFQSAFLLVIIFLCMDDLGGGMNSKSNLHGPQQGENERERKSKERGRWSARNTWWHSSAVCEGLAGVAAVQEWVTGCARCCWDWPWVLQWGALLSTVGMLCSAHHFSRKSEKISCLKWPAALPKPRGSLCYPSQGTAAHPSILDRRSRIAWQDPKPEDRGVIPLIFELVWFALAEEMSWAFYVISGPVKWNLCPTMGNALEMPSPAHTVHKHNNPLHVTVRE